MTSSLRCVVVVPTPITPPMGMANVGTHDGGWGAGGSRDFDLEALAATSRCCRLYLTHPLSTMIVDHRCWTKEVVD